MDDQTSWDDEDLLRAIDRCAEYLTGRGLSPITVDSDITYCRRFLRWRTGYYVPMACPSPIGRPVPTGKRVLAELRHELEQYGAFLLCGVKPSAIPTYVGPPRPSPCSALLADEFARIHDGHRAAIVRTVARMTLLPSVTRVFETGTADALTDLLLSLPVDELPELTDQNGYRSWFEAALERVAATILEFNPREIRSSIHPGYKWGHGAKVLSLFVRNLVMCSRHFTEEEASRVEPWLYCPIDGIVMKRLRRVGFDPGARTIREIDEAAAFWRIQDCLSIAADKAGVPRVWFDDIWSEDRD
jgi:hypothetical protein